MPEHLTPEDPIPQGKWFRPFINYGQIPYLKIDDYYSIKEVKIPKFEDGNLEIDAVWSLADQLDYLEDADKYPVFYYDGSDQKLILAESLRKKEMEDECHLINLQTYLFNSPDFPNNQYQLDILIPNGTVLRTTLLYDPYDTGADYLTHHLDWKQVLTGIGFQLIALPETEYILSQLAFSVRRIR